MSALVVERVELLRWYAAQGMRLLPVWEIGPDGTCACPNPRCEPRNWGKHPRIQDWVRTASSDVDVILAWHTEWPTCNWAWALDDHFVLDDDPRNGGFPPETFFQDWEEHLGFILPRTAVQSTGGNGLHVVYRQPPLGEVRNGPLYRDGTRLRGLEVKGVGGYVLVEPSNHVQGVYDWVRPWLEPVEAPVELLALRVKASAQGSSNGANTQWSGDPFNWQEALEPGAVEPGLQNETLHRAAWSCAGRGYDDLTALTMLRGVVRGFTVARADEPWEDRHADEMWERVKIEFQEKATPRESAPDYRPQLRLINGEGDESGGRGDDDVEHGDDDDGEPLGRSADRDNALELVRQFGDRIMWLPAQGWWLWDGRRWRHDSLNELVQLVAVVAESLRLRARGEHAEAFRRRAHRLDMVQGVTATLKYAQSLVAVRDEELDADPLLVNCPNGTLDLRTLQLREHDPSDRLTRCTGVDWDPEATSVLLEEYHATFMPDPTHQRGLYQLLGACLPGANDQRLLVLLVGDTTSGKSQLASGLERALGDYVGIGTASIFRGNLDDRPRPDIMKLLTSRIALLEEAGHSWELHGDRIKHLTGGGTLTVRGMRSNVFVDRVPDFTPVIIANEMPRVKAADAATQRRMRVVPFRHRPEVEDPMKKVAFLADEGCMRALLARVVAGYLDQREGGLELPHEFDVATVQAFDDLDDVREVINYAVDEGSLIATSLPDYQCARVSDVHRLYLRWIQDHGDATQRRDRLGLKTFNDRLRLMGWESVRSNGTRWRGVQLRDASMTYRP